MVEQFGLAIIVPFPFPALIPLIVLHISLACYWEFKLPKLFGVVFSLDPQCEPSEGCDRNSRNKECWRIALLLSTLLYPREVAVHCAGDNLNKAFKLEERRDLFKAAENAIVNLGLDKVWDLKPLLSTQDIMNVLQLKSGGPLIREWQEKLIPWQLAHPLGTAEECLR